MEITGEQYDALVKLMRGKPESDQVHPKPRPQNGAEAVERGAIPASRIEQKIHRC